MAVRLSWAVESFDLLPKSHMDGRRGASLEHALHFLVEKIHAC